jgi:hypothetical protein
MSNKGWIIATLLMIGLGEYFIANRHPRDQAAGLTISSEIDGPHGDNEK